MSGNLSALLTPGILKVNADFEGLDPANEHFVRLTILPEGETATSYEARLTPDDPDHSEGDNKTRFDVTIVDGFLDLAFRAAADVNGDLAHTLTLRLEDTTARSVPVNDQSMSVSPDQRRHSITL